MTHIWPMIPIAVGLGTVNCQRLLGFFVATILEILLAQHPAKNGIIMGYVFLPSGYLT